MKIGRTIQQRLQDEAIARRNLKMLEAKAVLEADGHLTLMRFTTHWKGMLGTPDLDYSEVWELPYYESLDDLVEALLGESAAAAIPTQKVNHGMAGDPAGYNDWRNDLRRRVAGDTDADGQDSDEW